MVLLIVVGRAWVVEHVRARDSLQRQLGVTNRANLYSNGVSARMDAFNYHVHREITLTRIRNHAAECHEDGHRVIVRLVRVRVSKLRIALYRTHLHAAQVLHGSLLMDHGNFFMTIILVVGRACFVDYLA